EGDPSEACAYNCKEMVDYITRYLTTIRERKVIPSPEVKPGYMRELLPDSAPAESEDWDRIFTDIEKIIMPGVVHWQSPHMHAYYPALTSWPSMLGDMLADAINNIGFTWASSPACTELEMNVMDWLCKALGLPSFFLHHHPDSTGGGILQGTVSESTLVALLAARKSRIQQVKRTESDGDLDDSVVNSRLVAYASDQAHSSVEKAGLISLVKIRFLPTDDCFSLRGDTLRRAIQEDRRRGLVPTMLCATLGTTGVCAFDDLSELGPVCAEEGLWLHVDAAYAGSAFICPELRGPLRGIEYADSFVFNPSKWMMVHFDCTAFWVKDKFKLQQTFSVDPIYLRHENSDQATDFMHWQIPLSRRFRSIKLWFVMRSFGLKNLQEHIRHGVEMAKLLESLVKSDPNFDMPAERHLGLVVFCLKRGNDLTQELLRRLTQSGTMYLIPADIDRKRIIRFTVTSQLTTSEDILRDWAIIHKMAVELLAEKEVVSKLQQVPQPSVRNTVKKHSETPSDPKNHNLTFTAVAECKAASVLIRESDEIQKAISDTEEPFKTPRKLGTDSAPTTENPGTAARDSSEEITSPSASRVPRAQPKLHLDGEPQFWIHMHSSGCSHEKVEPDNRVSRTVRSLSCSSEPLTGPIKPLSGPVKPEFNTDPFCKPTTEAPSRSIIVSQPAHKDPDFASPQNDAQTRLVSSSPSSSGPGLLLRIPKRPSLTNPNQLGKRVLTKLTKFYSMPSFCQLCVQCRHFQVCCPVSGLHLAPKTRTSAGCRRLSSSVL
uniref:Histidine decarboxylase n=1 Tax=Esox lucius TaxID=8010 RepID=A0A6Q2X5Z9_ESOLU